MVKCNLGPRMPSFLLTFFEMKLVLQSPSKLAGTSTRFPCLSLKLFFVDSDKFHTFEDPENGD